MSNQDNEAKHPSLPLARKDLSVIERAGVWYTSSPTAQAAVNLIPGVGGALAALLQGAGTELKEDRLWHFLEVLTREFQSFRSSTAFDESHVQQMLVDVIERVARTASDKKRERFARIIRNQFDRHLHWEEVEAFVRLLDELNDLHIQVLAATASAPTGQGAFGNLRVLSLVRPSNSLLTARMQDALPGIDVSTLRATCAALVARGLLHDEGVGRLDTRALEYFLITEFGESLLGWINESPKNE